MNALKRWTQKSLNFTNAWNSRVSETQNLSHAICANMSGSPFSNLISLMENLIKFILDNHNFAVIWWVRFYGILLFATRDEETTTYLNSFGFPIWGSLPNILPSLSLLKILRGLITYPVIIIANNLLVIRCWYVYGN